VQIARVAAAAIITIPLLLAVVLFIGVAARAPQEHAVTTPGAVPVQAQLAFGSYRPRSAAEPVAPTTSIDQLRCDSWRVVFQEACPDSAQMAKTLWPDVLQEPNTLYVGILTFCLASPEHLNAEYLRGTLTLHCHYASPWWRFERREMGVYAQMGIELVVVSTQNIPSGQVNVVLEERAERWIQDAVMQRSLGQVTIG